jgi:flagellar hook protein FlgE
MTISSSLNAGVAGLNANATRLATIADNIANAGTYGYRRATADFHSMVISGSGSGNYSAGGVRVTTGRLIDERGPLIATGNSTDLAIRGRGFLPVTTAVAVGAGNPALPLQLVTTGSFRPDVNGVLRTDTGLVLMGWPAASDGTVPPFPRDTLGGLEPVRINLNQFAGDPTTRIDLGVNLPATATRAGAPGTPQLLTLEYFSSLGTADMMEVSFTPTVPATGASNSWTMTISDPVTGDVVGEYTLQFDDSPGNGGVLQSVTQAPGAPGAAFDPATGAISISIGSSDIEIGLVGGNQRPGLSQLSDTFAPISIVKDGSPVGNLVGVEVDGNGLMRAIYDVGYSRVIYQIPLVDVPNPNGLISLDNQSYRISPDSGSFFLWDAGDGPTGEIVGYAREESATDVAGELTQLIQTQRAYSSNAKVIQTVDEMLQETTNLKR